MIISLAPRILTALRVGRKGPAFVDIRPCRGGARLTASNGHTVSVVASGADVMPLRLHWADLVRMGKMAGKETILLDGKQCRAGGFTFPITTMAPDAEAPRPSKVRLRLSDAVVTDVLRRVLPAMTDDDSRPHIYGVLLERRDGVLSATATDGHRLHQKKVASEGRDFSVMLPAPAAMGLVRLKGDLTLRLEEYPTNPDVRKRVLMRRGRDWVACDGVGNVGLKGSAKDPSEAMNSCAFPDFTAVIPTRQQYAVTVGVAALRRGLAIIHKYGHGQYHRPGKGTATMEWADGLRLSAGVSNGDNIARMIGEPIPGKGNLVGKVSVQARYLLGALGREGDVKMRFSGEVDPVTVESDGMVAVCMPLKI